jgi:trimethylamine--corrinoid protein Co-methyltransferase
MGEAAPARRRSGGRAARQAARAQGALAEKVPFITRTLRPFEVLSDEGLELI